MRILIAPAPFKECLSAAQVAAAIARGVHRARRDIHVECVPLSDGGTGFLETIRAALPVRITYTFAEDPRGRRVRVAFALSREDNTAYIESARACGLQLVAERFRNPLALTTEGLGQVIFAALRRGAKKVVVGLGGTATVDGGAGMAQALGVRFLDAEGRILHVRGGGDLARIRGVNLHAVHPLVAKTRFVALCDVQSPLLGPNGAARRFGPQKGATKEEVILLENGLRNFARVIATWQTDVAQASCLPSPCKRESVAQASCLPSPCKHENAEGTGAAGGIGLSLVSFFLARLVRGSEYVLNLVHLRRKLRGARLLVIGEGEIDGTTALGKIPFLAAREAHRMGIPVVAVCGRLGEGWQSMRHAGISRFIPLVRDPATSSFAISHARKLLHEAGRAIAETLPIGVAWASCP